jgi:hypothetical protein
MEAKISPVRSHRSTRRIGVMLGVGATSITIVTESSPLTTVGGLPGFIATILQL